MSWKLRSRWCKQKNVFEKEWNLLVQWNPCNLDTKPQYFWVQWNLCQLDTWITNFDFVSKFFQISWGSAFSAISQQFLMDSPRIQPWILTNLNNQNSHDWTFDERRILNHPNVRDWSENQCTGNTSQKSSFSAKLFWNDYRCMVKKWKRIQKC